MNDSLTLAALEMGKTPVVVLLLYMAILLFLGVLGYLRSKATEEDYYLAGRGQGVLVTALTIMATFFSSAAMLGIPGLIYKDGTAFLFFVLNLPVSGAIIYILGSRIRRIGHTIAVVVLPGLQLVRLRAFNALHACSFSPPRPTVP